jgi:hypothetical protein
MIVKLSAKLKVHQALSKADLDWLFHEATLHELGLLASLASRLSHGDVVHYAQEPILSSEILALNERSLRQALEDSETFEVSVKLSSFTLEEFQEVCQQISKLKRALPELVVRFISPASLALIHLRENHSAEHLMTQLKQAGVDILGSHFETTNEIIQQTESPAQLPKILRCIKNLHRACRDLEIKTDYELFLSPTDHQFNVQQIIDCRVETDNSTNFISITPCFLPGTNSAKAHIQPELILRKIAIIRLGLAPTSHIKMMPQTAGWDMAQLASVFGISCLVCFDEIHDLHELSTRAARLSSSHKKIADVISRSQKVPQQCDFFIRPFGTIPDSLSTSDRTSVDVILNRCKYGASVSHEDLISLAENADIHDLGSFFDIDGTKLNYDICRKVVLFSNSESEIISPPPVMGAIAPASTVGFIDISTLPFINANPEDDWHLFLMRLDTVAVEQGFKKFIVAGIKALIQFSSRSGISLQQIFADLRTRNVMRIEPSRNHEESGLTTTEIEAFHLLAHGASIPTAIRCELTVPIRGDQGVLWEDFIRQLIRAITLLEKTTDIEFCEITPTFDSDITLAEYIKGVCLAGICLTKLIPICTPLDLIPCQDHQVNAVDPLKFDNIMKQFGSSHYGSVDQLKFAHTIFEHIYTSSSTTPETDRGSELPIDVGVKDIIKLEGNSFD